MQYCTPKTINHEKTFRQIQPPNKTTLKRRVQTQKGCSKYSGSVRSGRKKRVLLFEDDQSQKNLYANAIRKNGFEVLSYESPAFFPIHKCRDCLISKALQCADIILTDIEMPKLQGIDFMEDRLSEGCKLQKIGIMSGSWSNENAKRALDLGCAVLEKPLPPSTLKKWLLKCDTNINPTTYKLFSLNSF